MRKLYYIVVLMLITLFFLNSSAFSYWVWTPETKKFINPKYSVKDTPKEQFEWANGFYEKADYKKAVFEFEKLIKNFPNSEYAPKAQYYIGRSYEDEGDLFRAFLNYQKVIDNFPYNDKIEEIIERQYKIGNLFYSGQKAKLLGMDILPGLDKAAEVFQKVVNNAPYGDYADLAQFKLGETYKKMGNYNDAINEFQKLVDTYPSSRLVDESRYQIALCANKASLGADYDQEVTDKAITEFKNFSEAHPESTLAKNVDETLKSLNEKKAGSSFKTAVFYERIGKHESAIIYYQDIIDQYPDSSYVKEAQKAITELTTKLEAKRSRASGKRKEKVAAPKKEQTKSVGIAEPEASRAKKAEVPSEKITEEAKSDIRSTEVFEKTPVSPQQTKPETTKKAAAAVKKEEKKKESAEKPKKSFWSSLAFGYTTGSLLPSNIKTIFIDNFVNKIDVTVETTNVNKYKLYRAGLETDITNSVQNAFNRDGNLLLAKQKDGDLKLYGDLVAVDRQGLRYDTNDNYEEYRLYIIVNLVMKNSKDEVVWEEKNFTGESTYSLTGSNAKSENAALDEAINDLSQRILERTIEDW